MYNIFSIWYAYIVLYYVVWFKYRSLHTSPRDSFHGILGVLSLIEYCLKLGKSRKHVFVENRLFKCRLLTACFSDTVYNSRLPASHELFACYFNRVVFSWLLIVLVHILIENCAIVIKYGWCFRIYCQNPSYPLSIKETPILYS